MFRFFLTVFRSLALYAGSGALPSLFCFFEAEPLSLNASARLERRRIDVPDKWPNPWGRAEGEERSGEGVE